MIEAQGLRRVWRKNGRTVGLLGVGFQIPDGQVVGVLGENGTGKTTLLRLIAGLLEPQNGSVSIDGLPACAQYRRISFITGEGSYYPTLTIGEYGQFLQDLHSGFDPSRYQRFVDFFELESRDKIAKLSTGQRIRVELAAGFAKRADYYLMDEPFLGKDPLTRIDFIKLIGSALRGHETLLLSTHYLDDVESFLDRALILHQGSLMKDVILDDLHENGQTLLDCMKNACRWDAEHYLSFEAES